MEKTVMETVIDKIAKTQSEIVERLNRLREWCIDEIKRHDGEIEKMVDCLVVSGKGDDMIEVDRAVDDAIAIKREVEQCKYRVSEIDEMLAYIKSEKDKCEVTIHRRDQDKITDDLAGARIFLRGQ